jgi:hypothetical protein
MSKGELVIAPALAGQDLQALGIVPGMKLRWVNALHQAVFGSASGQDFLRAKKRFIAE